MLLAILRGTPIQIWILLAGLIALGVSQARARTLGATRVAALPLILVALSLAGVVSSFGGSTVALPAWLTGMAVALAVAPRCLPTPAARWSPSLDAVHVAGSWLPLALISASSPSSTRPVSAWRCTRADAGRAVRAAGRPRLRPLQRHLRGARLADVARPFHRHRRRGDRVSFGAATSLAGGSPRIAAVNTVTADPRVAPVKPRWRGFFQRGVIVAGAAVLVAICLWAISTNAFWPTLVYSECISLMCWLFIDTTRGVVAALQPVAVTPGGRLSARWPGRIWMVAIVVVGAILGYAAGNEIANMLLGLHQTGPFNSSWRQTMSLLVFALVPAITITYFFQSREVIATQQADVERAERQAAEQQLMLLESQLEPHMLFNTLANLRVLIGVDAERAQAMLDHLIAFLRASLTGSRERFHPLADEFARLADYLALMKIRMGPRLQTSFELPAELGAAPVPPLLLQPLVENCIKHGLEPKVSGGRIDVSARRDGDSLVVSIRDDGIGMAAGNVDGSGASFGLAHVRERLHTLYGASASFTFAAADDGAPGTLATVRLPLAPAMEQAS